MVPDQLSGIMVAQSISSGPIPSAEQMKLYKEVGEAVPGIIMDMARAEQNHRHEMDRREITLREDESRAEIDNLKAERTLLVGGAVAYMILLFALFASSFYLTMHNHPYAAASLLALVSGVTVFA